MDFTGFQLGVDEREQLLAAQLECTVSWINADGWPVSTVQTYLWARDAVWVTCFRDRARVACLVREPRSSIAVSSTGTALGPEQMISTRTLATVHEAPEVADWFFTAFCRRASDDDAQAASMARVLARQDRVVIELRPQAWNSFNGALMRAH